MISDRPNTRYRQVRALCRGVVSQYVQFVKATPYVAARSRPQGLLVGAIICSDLRTAGLWKAGRWREGLETCAPVAAAGLALAIVTGALLFSVRGGHYASDPAFLAKALLIMIGLANILVFRRAMARQSGESPSVTMKLSAMCSIAVWVCAVFAGRWIAFTS